MYLKLAEENRDRYLVIDASLEPELQDKLILDSVIRVISGKNIEEEKNK